MAEDNSRRANAQPRRFVDLQDFGVGSTERQLQDIRVASALSVIQDAGVDSAESEEHDVDMDVDLAGILQKPGLAAGTSAAADAEAAAKTKADEEALAALVKNVTENTLLDEKTKANLLKSLEGYCSYRFQSFLYQLRLQKQMSCNAFISICILPMSISAIPQEKCCETDLFVCYDQHRHKAIAEEKQRTQELKTQLGEDVYLAKLDRLCMRRCSRYQDPGQPDQTSRYDLIYIFDISCPSTVFNAVKHQCQHNFFLQFQLGFPISDQRFW